MEEKGAERFMACRRVLARSTGPRAVARVVRQSGVTPV